MKNTCNWSKQRYHGSFHFISKTRCIIYTYMTYPYFKNQDRRALEGEILRVNHVKIIILAREKRAHQTKIYSVHFHGVRPFSCFTPIANHTLLGQNSMCLVSTSILSEMSNQSCLLIYLTYLIHFELLLRTMLNRWCGSPVKAIDKNWLFHKVLWLFQYFLLFLL